MRRVAALVLGVAVASGCGAPLRVAYPLPQGAFLPVGAHAVVDRREEFARLFCGVLAHTGDGASRPCGDYLHVDDSIPADTVGANDAILAGRGVLLVGGIFARCVDVEVFQDVRRHLAEHHQLRLEHLPVFGNGSSLQNAGEIDRFFQRQPQPVEWIVVGHSKGAVDLLEALVFYPALSARVKALVTVASPVGGSRLVDGVPAWLKGLAQDLPRLGECELGDGLGQSSLSRPIRQGFFRDFLPRVNALRSYGIVAVASRENTSEILKGLWDYQARFSIDQDTHVIAEDALLPGTNLLARANGDHWAVAFPVALSDNRKLRDGADRNGYPRTALLEAILRTIERDLRP